MKEKPVIFGSANWTVRQELIGAVERATSDACYTGRFVRSNIIVNEDFGTASFKIHKSSIRGYDKFISAIVKADKELREQEHAGVVYKAKRPK